MDDTKKVILFYQFHRFFFIQFSVLFISVLDALLVNNLSLVRKDLHPLIVLDDHHGNMDLLVINQQRLPNLKTGQPLIVSYGAQPTLCEIDVPVVKRLVFPLESLYVPVVVTVTAKVYVLPPPV